MAHKVITAVTAEPVSLAEAKLHLRLDDIGGSHPHDGLIATLITGAREFAQHYTGRALAAQTLEIGLDKFPESSDAIPLPMMPVASVTSVKYYDSDGTLQTLDSADYALHVYGLDHKVALTYGNTWPSTRDIPNAVQVRYVTGYGATGHSSTGEYAACPKAAKQAILLQVELDYPANQFTPQEREARARARDALLGIIRLWGF